MSESEAPLRHRPFLSVPAWDISDEEISEWKRTPGMGLAAFTAERIIGGHYDGGDELYPVGSPVYLEITSDAVDQAMEVLAERGMARKEGDAWRAIAPGRLEPSLRRAVAALLSRRDDLPPALAAELDTWTRALQFPRLAA